MSRYCETYSDMMSYDPSNPVDDLLAYLVVLNHYPTIKKLSSEEYSRGSSGVMGCLHRVMDFVEDRDWVHVRTLIKDRERLNGFLPYGDAKLEAATAILSHCILGILRSENKGRLSASQEADERLAKKENVEKDFMNRLDSEFAKILGKQ